MTKYREILRLKSLGFSERNIAQSCGVSRNTVAKVLKKAAEIKLSWPLDFDMTDSALEELMFPKDKSATNKRMPNFDYIRKELLRNGVNKKLLWVEYCEECRMSSEEPLMYSQFCYYIQKDEEKRRATMHIPRKPGEQIEVDWAGDPAHIIDPDTGEITDGVYRTSNRKKGWTFSRKDYLPVCTSVSVGTAEHGRAAGCGKYG